MFTKAFWLDLAERVISTFAQSLLGAFTADGLGLNLTWRGSLAVAGLASLASLLKCLAALKVGAPDSASLLPESVDPPQEDGYGLADALIFIACVILVIFLLQAVVH